MKLVNFINFLLFMVVTIACSSNKNTTSTKFVIGNLLSPGAQLSGALIYGINRKNGQTMRIKFATETDKQSIQLSQGNWTFAAIGWPQNAGEELVGTPKCGSIDVNLDQPAQALALNISQAGCANPIFGPNTDDFKDVTGATFALKGIKIANCVVGPDGYCATLGPFRSYKFIAQADNGKLVSPCLDQTNTAVKYLNTASSATTAQLTFPFFQGIGPTPVAVEAYTGTGCSTTAEIAKLPDGITQYTNINQTKLFSPKEKNTDLPPGTVVVPFSEAIVCSGDRLAAAPFASGSHQTSGSKWDNIICTVAQLEVMSSLSPLSGTYALHADLSVGAHTPIPGFTGSFEGNDHTLSNITISTATANSGLFGSVTSSSAYIEDLNIDNLTLTHSVSSGRVGALIGDFFGGKIYNVDLSNINITIGNTGAYVGGAVGYTTGTTSIFYGITVTSATIAGANSVTAMGGFAGTLSSASDLFRIALSNITLSASSSATMGGIVGSLDNTRTYDVSLNNLTLSLVTPVAGGIGGAFGEVTNNAQAEFVKLTGTNNINVVGYVAGSGVGGIAGRVLNNGSVRNSRADITITASAEMIGGAVGELNSVSAPHAQVIGVSTTGNINCTLANTYCGGSIGKVNINGTLGPFPQVMDVTSNANVTGIDNVGGAFGAILGGTIDAVIAKGIVYSTTGTSVGGFAGKIQSSAGEIDLKNSYSTATVSGFSYVGGFAGKIDRSSNLYINSTYAYGTATGTSFVTPYEGAIGTAPFGINNYYVQGGLTSAMDGGVTASVPLASFTSTTPFAGFDFTKKWIGVSGAIPDLRMNYILTQFGNTLGSPGDRFQIGSTTAFNLIGDNRRLMFSHFVQTANLDFGLGAPNPIGTASNPFSGSYLADDFAIQNVTITTSVGDTNIGLFRYVSGAHIGGYTTEDSVSEIEGKLYLDHINITGSASSNVGLLVGTATMSSWGQPSVFTNIVIDSLSSINVPSANYVGSVVGTATGAAFYNIRNAASVTASSYAGGIFGSILGPSPQMPMNKLMNTGAITTTGQYAGGIGGYTYFQSGPPGTTVNEVFVSANISVGNSTNAGGLFGMYWGPINITNILVANSTITATTSGTNHVGGFSGQLQGNSGTSGVNHFMVYNNTITATGSSWGRVFGSSATFGLTPSAIYTDTATNSTDNGVTATTAATLMSGQTFGFDTEVWDFAAGSYPTLKFISE